MSNRLLQLIILCSLVFATDKPAQADSLHHRYPVKSCIIDFELNGMQKGRETLYIDDYGKREARYSKTTLGIGDSAKKSNTLMLMDETWIYNIDLINKTGTKTMNPVHAPIPVRQEFKDMITLNHENMRKMGGKLIGEEEFLKKKCEVWEIKALHSKTWIWNGIILRSIVNTMGMKQEVRAVKLQENVNIPPEKLTLPKELKLTEVHTPDKMLRNFNP
ncbi:MAG: hypothetical protein GXO91_10035, partial [FCB group bacterium]|nr:hypothetical protein [FCB group bacterium]